MVEHNLNGANKITGTKDNDLQAVFDYLQSNVATATMTAIALNIYRPSLCRRKRELERAGLLMEVKKSLCKVTKCRAAYLSTNPDLFPMQSQFKMF